MSSTPHVGERNRRDKEVMDRHGFKERNLEGQMVVDLLEGCRSTISYVEDAI